MVNKKQEMEQKEEFDLFVRRITHALSLPLLESEAAAKKFFTLPSNEQAAYLDDLDALDALDALDSLEAIDAHSLSLFL